MPALQEICLYLDEVTEQFFQTLDTIYEQQEKLDNLLANGFSHMAKVGYFSSESINILSGAFPLCNLRSFCKLF